MPGSQQTRYCFRSGRNQFLDHGGKRDSNFPTLLLQLDDLTWRLPAIDAIEDLLISPVYPHEPLGIIHLAGHTHETILKVAIREGGFAEILLTRSSVMHWFSNRRDQSQQLDAKSLKRLFSNSGDDGDSLPLELQPGARMMRLAEIGQRKTPTILLAWELGSGLGHVMALLRLSARLSQHRVRMIAAVRDPTVAQTLARYDVDVVQAPVWPLLTSSGIPQSSATMAENLASSGFADEQAMAMLLRAWDRLLALIKPDLIVGDYAPAAALAARGRVPLILVGNGFTLPPDDMGAFPLLHRVSPPIWSEETILDCVNKALKTIACEPIERLPQIFAADYRSVQTFALLDPYRSRRTERVDGPVLEPPPIARQPNAHTIFVYLRQHRHLRPAVVETLLPFAKRLRVFGPGIAEGQLADLAQRGAKVEFLATSARVRIGNRLPTYPPRWHQRSLRSNSGRSSSTRAQPGYREGPQRSRH